VQLLARLRGFIVAPTAYVWKHPEGENGSSKFSLDVGQLESGLGLARLVWLYINWLYIEFDSIFS